MIAFSLQGGHIPTVLKTRVNPGYIPVSDAESIVSRNV